MRFWGYFGHFIVSWVFFVSLKFGGGGGGTLVILEVSGFFCHFRGFMGFFFFLEVLEGTSVILEISRYFVHYRSFLSIFCHFKVFEKGGGGDTLVILEILVVFFFFFNCLSKAFKVILVILKVSDYFNNFLGFRGISKF